MIILINFYYYRLFLFSLLLLKKADRVELTEILQASTYSLETKN